MSTEKKVDARELFKNCTPEIIEYDAHGDSGCKPKHAEYITPKTEKNETKFIKLSEEKKLSIQEMFKDYVPEILEYDPEIDGRGEHFIREVHLSAKEALIEKVRKAKAARKKNKTTFR